MSEKENPGVTVTLKNGAVLRADVSGNWMTLDAEDRAFVIAISDLIHDYNRRAEEDRFDRFGTRLREMGLIEQPQAAPAVAGTVDEGTAPQFASPSSSSDRTSPPVPDGEMR